MAGIAFPDEAAALWAEIKSGASEKAWFLLSIDGEDKKKLNVSASGRCGLKHVCRFLQDDQIQFGAFRLFALDAKSKVPRFCLFTFKGSKAPLKLKAAAGNIASPFAKFFEGAHHEFEFNGLDDVTEAAVVAKLSAAKGSFKPSGYEFGTGNDEDMEEDEIRAAEEEAARIAEDERLAAEEAARIAAEKAAEEEAIRKAEEERQRRLAMLPPRTIKDAKRAHRERIIEGYDLSELTERFATEAFNDVEDTFSWIVLHVTEEDPKKLTVSGTGSGGLDEIVACLRDDDIQYGALRVAAIDRRGARLSIRPKLITFTWIGSAISTKTKLRNSGVSKAFGAYFVKPTIDLQVDGDRADLEEGKLFEKLKRCVASTEFRYGVYDRDTQADDYIAQLAAIGITDEKAAAEAARAAHSGAGATDE